MRRFAILALAAVTLVTTGCASTQSQSRSCSGRLTTDNGHVTRNEEDCVWGDKYANANANTKPRVVYVERAPAYREPYPAARPVYEQPAPIYVPQYVSPPVYAPRPDPVFGLAAAILNGVLGNQNRRQGRR